MSFLLQPKQIEGDFLIPLAISKMMLPENILEVLKRFNNLTLQLTKPLSLT